MTPACQRLVRRHRLVNEAKDGLEQRHIRFALNQVDDLDGALDEIVRQVLARLEGHGIASRRLPWAVLHGLLTADTELDVRNVQDVARRQERERNALIVDERSIGAAQILHA